MTAWSPAEAARLREAVERLDGWVAANGWAGWDPYDVKGTPAFMALQRRSGRAWRLALGAASRLERAFPLAARRLLGVRPAVNAKAMGLFARGYLHLFQATGEARFRARALECLEWLRDNPTPGLHGLGWGYPFDWQSRRLIPRGTPSSVVSSVAGDAFWTAYQVLGDPAWLRLCERVCDFFERDLNRADVGGGVVCFSYTPLDDFQVHNASLFVAEFLARVGAETGNAARVELGKRAADFALREQNPDGSIFYWSAAQGPAGPGHVDHYHSGFEIRALFGMGRATGDARYTEAAHRYYRFYRGAFLTDTGGGLLPNLRPGRPYPVNVHAAAEAVLLNAELAPHCAEAARVLPGVCRWAVENMQTPEGWFVYQLERQGPVVRAVRIPYIRWGQAWMLLALARALQRVQAAPEGPGGGA
jgi:rhamnogalacturonyl hydrolase YesR